MAELFRYAAFVSYSSKDGVFARRLHRALETYSIPASLGTFDLIGGGKKNRIYPVFRDRDELAAGDLGERIRLSLQASSALIVVCSPHAAASTWVQKEIEFFAGLGRADRIFAVIPTDAPLSDDNGTDSTSTCFPSALSIASREGIRREPLAGDARRGKDGFRLAMLKLVAGLANVSVGLLIDREANRHRARRIATALGAIAAATLLYVGFASWQTLDWRSGATALAADFAGRGRSVQAVPLALAGVNGRGDLLPFRADTADEALFELSRGRVIAEFGVAYAMPNERQADIERELDDAFFEHRGVTAVVHRFDQVVALDLQTGVQTELGPLLHFNLDPSGFLLFVVRDDVALSGAIYDARSHRVIELGPMGPISRSMWSMEGAVLAVLHRLPNHTSSDPGPGEIIDMASGSRTSLGEILTWFDVSSDGQTVAFQRIDSTVVVTQTRSGEVREFGRALGMDLSSDGATLLVSRENSHVLVDLATSRRTELPRSGMLSPTFLNMGRSVLLSEQQPGTLPDYVILDVRSGRRIEAGEGVPPRFVEDGAGVVFFSDGAYSLIDLRVGATTPLERLGFGSRGDSGHSALNDQYAMFSVDGDAEPWMALDLRRAEVINGWLEMRPATFRYLGNYVVTIGHSVATLRTRDQSMEYGLGPADRVELANDGKALFLRREDMTVTIFDTQTQVWPSASPAQGRALSSAVCAVNGANVAPLSHAIRRSENATSRMLRGRPWNPCDWRGLGAIFPSASLGDGWFEGARQWWRRVEVIYFGRGDRDYDCGEGTTAMSAATRDARARMCLLFGPESPAERGALTR